MSARERRPGDDGGIGGSSAANQAPAIGKHTLVQTAMAGAPVVQRKPAASEADRVADLANRGAAADPAITTADPTVPHAFPAPSGSKPQQRHDAAAARL